MYSCNYLPNDYHKTGLFNGMQVNQQEYWQYYGITKYEPGHPYGPLVYTSLPMSILQGPLY